ncbi:hypothetical protein GO730_00540 [Spirosoma sp. HMF3257]|uniref:DUF4393 domain-containing protein n=1 Tax=Spirosoma telluris TaxID=2183553 RepID=A0A327NL40_9BACT|nr:hypothetical protein [Spirosoma telluris]RAI73288.1 hypothetical protein HMF3257_00525 [Spirosoma telluris]
MMELAKLATDPDAIKAIAEKSENLLKSLFGKAFSEFGESIADQVRLRRFKNQIKILERANEYLKDSKIEYKKINLKVLAPLIENASYEEEELLQERWAKLIKNILIKPISLIQQQNAVEILNKISNEEAVLLEYIYRSLASKKAAFEADYQSMRPDLFGGYKNDEKLSLESSVNIYSFSIKELAAKLRIKLDDIETQISNLVALGTLKYVIEVDVTSAEKRSDDPEDNDLDIELDVEDYKNIKLTKMGFIFIELCEK